MRFVAALPALRPTPSPLPSPPLLSQLSRFAKESLTQLCVHYQPPLHTPR